MKTSEVLHKAADLIEERGWWSMGHGFNETVGSVISGRCASNALTAVSDVRLKAHRAFVEYLGFSAGTTVGVIFNWNDAPERTAEDVVAALRACALEQELKEAAARGPLSTGPTVRVPAPRPPVVSGVVGAGHRPVAEVGAK